MKTKPLAQNKETQKVPDTTLAKIPDFKNGRPPGFSQGIQLCLPIDV